MCSICSSSFSLLSSFFIAFSLLSLSPPFVFCRSSSARESSFSLHSLRKELSIYTRPRLDATRRCSLPSHSSFSFHSPSIRAFFPSCFLISFIAILLLCLLILLPEFYIASLSFLFLPCLLLLVFPLLLLFFLLHFTMDFSVFLPLRRRHRAFLSSLSFLTFKRILSSAEISLSVSPSREGLKVLWECSG